MAEEGVGGKQQQREEKAVVEVVVHAKGKNR
jgi:hypothetical protein